MTTEPSPITRDDVARARAELIESGRRPSQRAVLGVLGRGSFSTIGPWLRELDAEAARGGTDASAVPVTDPLDAAVRDAVARAWNALGTEADGVVERARRGFERELANARDARDRATAATERVQERSRATAGRLEETRAELAATASELDRVRREHAAESVAHARSRARADGLEALAGERLAALERAERERGAGTERVERLEAELRAEREGRAADRLAADAAARDALDGARAEHERERAERDRRLGSLGDELGRVRGALERAEAASDAERQTSARLRERLDEREAAARAAVDERAGAERRLATLEANVAALERERDSLERAAAARLADRDALLEALSTRVGSGGRGDAADADVRARAASPRDAPTLRAVAERAYARYVPRIGRRPAPMDADYGAAVAKGLVRVIENDEGVVGYVVVREADGALLLENMAVAPEHAGRGHGRRLVALAETRARELGLSRIELYTNAAMVENLALYAHLGFVRTGRRHEDGFDRVFLAREL